MKRGNAAKNSKKAKTPPVSKDPKAFETAFQKRLGKSPADYLIEKIQSGSSVASIEYLFDIVSAEIATKNHCECKGCNLRSPTATGAVVNGHSAVRQRPA